MNRDEILKEAQKNPATIGESEAHFQRRGAILASLLGLLIAAIMVFTEYFYLHKMDFGKVAIFTTIVGVSDLYEGIKNKSRKLVIAGVIGCIFTVFFLILYVKGVYFE